MKPAKSPIDGGASGFGRYRQTTKDLAVTPVLAPLIGIALLLGTAAVQARTVELLHSGYWTAFGGTADDGHPVCGIISSGAEGRTFTVKLFQGDDHLTVQVFKPSWQVPPGTRVAISMQFDRNAPWTANAIGMESAKGVELTVPLDRAVNFSNEVRAASTMRLSFPNGSEAPWIGDMTGSNNSVSAMVTCINALNRTNGGPTQPFGDATPAPQPPPMGQPIAPIPLPAPAPGPAVVPHASTEEKQRPGSPGPSTPAPNAPWAPGSRI